MKAILSFVQLIKLVSSFLSIPYSVGRGSANVNAGAVFASYLVFDELHLLDPHRSFATMLELLNQVQGISPFLLMTATLTEELANQIRMEIAGRNPRLDLPTDSVIYSIGVEEKDLAVIETHQRRFTAIATPLTASGIFQDIQDNKPKRVIIICNTVAQAQGLFLDLKLDLEEEITGQSIEPI